VGENGRDKLFVHRAMLDSIDEPLGGDSRVCDEFCCPTCLLNAAAKNYEK
jgi:hypothetical protein